MINFSIEKYLSDLLHSITEIFHYTFYIILKTSSEIVLYAMVNLWDIYSIKKDLSDWFLYTEVNHWVLSIHYSRPLKNFSMLGSIFEKFIYTTADLWDLSLYWNQSIRIDNKHLAQYLSRWEIVFSMIESITEIFLYIEKNLWNLPFSLINLHCSILELMRERERARSPSMIEGICKISISSKITL